MFLVQQREPGTGPLKQSASFQKARDVMPGWTGSDLIRIVHFHLIQPLQLKHRGQGNQGK